MSSKRLYILFSNRSIGFFIFILFFGVKLLYTAVSVIDVNLKINYSQLNNLIFSPPTPLLPRFHVASTFTVEALYLVLGFVVTWQISVLCLWTSNFRSMGKTILLVWNSHLSMDKGTHKLVWSPCWIFRMPFWSPLYSALRNMVPEVHNKTFASKWKLGPESCVVLLHAAEG